jgi:hypothetical protein
MSKDPDKKQKGYKRKSADFQIRELVSSDRPSTGTSNDGQTASQREQKKTSRRDKADSKSRKVRSTEIVDNVDSSDDDEVKILFA